MFEHWEHAEAKVIDRKLVPTGNATTSTPAKHAYVVEIQPPDGKPFRVEIDDPMIRMLSYRGAQIGETVAVLVDFKREKAKLDTHDAARRGDDPFASGRASNERFAASLAGTKPGASDASARVDMVAALRMLDAQVASGSITQEQYQTARREAIHQATGVPSAAQESGVGDHGAALTNDEPVGSQAPAEVVGELAKLADLKTQGLLTDAEFTVAKQKLLERS
jgi:hypothetical protein